MLTIPIKPLSVNEAWQGKRFKTPAYLKYEKSVLFLLQKIVIPNPPYRLSYEFGFSMRTADLDNPVKLFTDIIQKKYGINDKDIFELHVKKVIVAKGQEYVKFQIESL